MFLFSLSIIFTLSTEVGISIPYLWKDLRTQKFNAVITLSLLRRVKVTHQANNGSSWMPRASHIMLSQLGLIPLDPLEISSWWCRLSTLLETSIPQSLAASDGCRVWIQSTCLSSIPRVYLLNVLGYYWWFVGDIHQRWLDSIYYLQLCLTSMVCLHHLGTLHHT